MCPRLVDEGREDEGLVTDGSAHYAGTTRKWTAEALPPLSATTPKDPGEGKSSEWADLQAVHMVIHSAWKENGQKCNLLFTSYIQ